MTACAKKEKEIDTAYHGCRQWLSSRFGSGIKQLELVDDGHIIMDYSIHDAI